MYSSCDYSLVAADLTQTTELTQALLSAHLDTSLPTLLLSEVAITYMEPTE